MGGAAYFVRLHRVGATAERQCPRRRCKRLEAVPAPAGPQPHCQRCSPCRPRWATSRFGVGDDTSDWRVKKIVVSGKLKSNESVLFQVGRGPL